MYISKKFFIIGLFLISNLICFSQAKKIKSISGDSYTAEGEKSELIYKEYRSDGKILIDNHLLYYIDIQHTYDEKGREIAVDAMYGETSAHDTIFYYEKGFTKITRSPNFYFKSENIFGKNDSVVSSVVFFFSNYEKRKEIHKYEYDKNKNMTLHKSSIDYFEEGNNYEEMYSPTEKEILDEFKTLKVLKKSEQMESNQYDKNGNLLKHENKNITENKTVSKTFYEYDKDSKLLKETYYADTTVSYVVDYKYDKFQTSVIRTDYQYQCTPQGRVRTETKNITENKLDSSGLIIESVTKSDSGSKSERFYENGLLKKEMQYNDDGSLYETIVYDYEFWE